MAAAVSMEIGGLNPFEISGERTSLGFRWAKWLRSFELYAGGKGVTNPEQKKALLLHCAGSEVQDLFFTLDCPNPVGDETVFDVAKTLLNDNFVPEVNVAYERSVFRGMSQLPNESVEMYISRLRQRAKYCNFHNIDEMIRDQVIEKCSSHRLRRKLLERTNVTLQQVRQIALSIETSEKQATTIENFGKLDINAVKTTKYPTFRSKSMDRQHRQSMTPQSDKSRRKCYSCGYNGHESSDERCPARGKKCNYCKKIGHFGCQCRTKLNRSRKKTNWKSSSTTSKQIRFVDDDDSSSEHDDETELKNYVFVVQSEKDKTNKVLVNIGDIPTEVIIDSGSCVNVIDRLLWENLKSLDIKCTSKLTNKLLYAYGNDKPLAVAGVFTTTVSHRGNKVETDIYVIEEKGQALLSSTTSKDLGILKIVQSVNDIPDIRTQFPACFDGLGKLKDFELKIPIDETVTPVIQPLRRVPYNLRDKLEKKLDELESLDIIEKVNKPSAWVSPIVVVPKKDDVRLCIDMRRANEAVIRERHPIPTVDEIIQDLNKSSVFSKLDIKMAYHQIELAEESREITTFMTHKGLYRYKRLLFGVSCAPEMYNKVLQQTLSGLQGVSSIYDDIVVHGETTEQHSERLAKLMQRLQEHGLTLNWDKCQFNMTHIDFMGIVLSSHGIGMAETKVEAVLNATEPKSASEVKSFLGMVNFSARFIPNMASIAEPMRKLTRKNVNFHWGPDQKKCFEELKLQLANAATLGYFDQNDKTQVICDASPVGIAAMLVQENTKEESRVITYVSRSLTDIERKYSQTEREALAIVWACERLHMYLIGMDFELLTDHKALEFIFSPKSKPSARVERWVLRLQPFRYKVKHIPGSKNVADSLSRLTARTEQTGIDYLDTETYIRTISLEATPNAMSTSEIETESERDPELYEIRKCLKTNNWNELSNKQYLPIRHELSSIGYLVLRGTRIVIPERLRPRVLDLGHEGHPGIVIMKQRLRSKVWWPGVDKDIEKTCKYCTGCQFVARPEKPEPINRRELPNAPWEHLCADFLGPLPSGESLLVIVDYYSRWLEIFVMKSTTSEKIIQCLKELFSVHGYPLSIQTDNAMNFNSEQLNSYLNSLNIEHRNTTPIWPQANGEVEVQNKSIMKRIRIAHAEKQNWKDELLTYLLMYRSTPHSTTGVSPAEMLFRRKIRTKIPDIVNYENLDDIVRDRDSEMKGKGKIYADQRRNVRQSEIYEGDIVLMKQSKENKLSTTFNPNPMTVVRRNGSSVIIESSDGVRYQRNVSHVKKFFTKCAISENSDKSYHSVHDGAYMSASGKSVSVHEQSDHSVNDQYGQSDQSADIPLDRSIRQSPRTSLQPSPRTSVQPSPRTSLQPTPRTSIEQSPRSPIQQTPRTSVQQSPRESHTDNNQPSALATPERATESSRPTRSGRLPTKFRDFVMK